jgi:hypothetical protein
MRTRAPFSPPYRVHQPLADLAVDGDVTARGLVLLRGRHGTPPAHRAAVPVKFSVNIGTERVLRLT